MVDIIIPAYNAHDTINKTLCSIAMQEFKEKFNVYIIDDCSDVDYSKEVKLFSSRINITQLKMEKNGGPGLSRQFGIDNSHGKYILFVDSDDLLYDCFSLQNIYNSIISDDYDGAVGIMVDETPENLYEYYNHTGCLHGKMYKREFLENNNIRFNDTRSSEDNAFNQLFLLASPRIVYNNNYIYLYKNNENSITQKDRYNYAFYSVEHYINNMLWAINIAFERNYDLEKIAILIFWSYTYVFANYFNNLHRNDVSLIFKWVFPLHMLYKEYNNMVSNEYKNYYMQDYNAYNINISLREFSNLVDLYNNI